MLRLEFRSQSSEVGGRRALKAKRGQVGDTVTWFVATIVIVTILLFFIFGASMLGSTKSVGKHKESLTSKATYEGENLFLKKSIYTYLTVPQSGSKSVMDRYFEAMDEAEIFDSPVNDEISKVRRRLVKK